MPTPALSAPPVRAAVFPVSPAHPTTAKPSITDFYYAGLWGAIRAGWREGYTAGIRVTEVVPEVAPFSRFVLDVSALVNPRGEAEERYGGALRKAEKLCDLIRQARSVRKIARPCDYELALAGAPIPTTAEDLVFCVRWLKSRGKPVQLVAPQPGADLKEVAAAARSCQCLLTLDSRAGTLAEIAAATMGRVNYRAVEEDVATIAGQLLI